MRAATYMELHPIIPHRCKHLIVALCAIVSLFFNFIYSLRLYFHHCFLSFEFLFPPLYPRSFSISLCSFLTNIYFFFPQMRCNLSILRASKVCLYTLKISNAQIEFRVDFVLDSTFRVTIESNLNAYSSLWLLFCIFQYLFSSSATLVCLCALVKTMTQGFNNWNFYRNTKRQWNEK